MDHSWDMGTNNLLLGKMSPAKRLGRRVVLRTVWWIKRDIRISDNHCLFLATQSSDEVIPFFCWEPSVLNANDYGSFHLQAQWQALKGLFASLHKRGSGIVEGKGEVVAELNTLYKTHPFQKLRSYQETGNNITFRRDRAVREWCREHGVEWVESVGSNVVRGMSAQQKRRNRNNNRGGRLKVLPIPNNLKPPQDKSVFSIPMEWKEIVAVFPKFLMPISPHLQKVNERCAWDTLDSFLQDRGAAYSGGISSPNSAFSAGSRLSPHLAWGTISTGSVFDQLDRRREQVYAEKIQSPWKRSLRAFESRLYWRDHFVQRLEGRPQMEFTALNPAYESIDYENDEQMLGVWLEGRTGYPLVDACMRCLAATGFLNFRMRAMVVSFACFGLHLSWRTIHGPLARIFLDYEPGIHLSQLQMQAGITGINAIRVYSPSKQFLDHDADGTFIKQWVPELGEYTPAEIAHAELISLAGYPSPVVRLKERAKTMKDRIFEVRQSVLGKQYTSEVLKKHGSRKVAGGRRKRKKIEDVQLALFKD
jgi:deoxyribodipyrimidine photo-lyase